MNTQEESTIQGPEKRARIASRIIAALTGAFGLLVVGYTVTAIIEVLKTDEGWAAHAFFIFFFCLPLLAFGAFCVRTAWRMWAKVSARAVRYISFAAAIVICFLVLGSLPTLLGRFSPSFEEHQRAMVVMPLVMLFGAGVYHLLKRLLLKLLNLIETPDTMLRTLAVKRYMWWLASFVFVSLMQVVMYFDETTESKHAMRQFMPILDIVAAIVVATVLYKLGVRLLLGRPEEIKSPLEDITTED